MSQQEWMGAMVRRIRDRQRMREGMPGDVNETLAMELDCMATSLEEIAAAIQARISPDEIMQDFYLSDSYNPKAERPADNVKAAIAFALGANPCPHPAIYDRGECCGGVVCRIFA